MRIIGALGVIIQKFISRNLLPPVLPPPMILASKNSRMANV